MRHRIVGLVLAACLCLSGTVFGQGDYSYVPPVSFTGPLGHLPVEGAAWYAAVDLYFMRLDRPLASQPVAVRGFLTTDTTLTGTVGQFVGSGAEALDVEQLRGPGSYTPGYNLTLGYRFDDGVTVQFSKFHAYNVAYQARAGIIPPGFAIGQQQENTFLTSNVVNVPQDFAGNDVNVAGGGAGSTYGIWNAATAMSIEFDQQWDIYKARGRFPIWETPDFRFYGILGPRVILLYERFLWTTVDEDTSGNYDPSTIGLYTNKIHNHLIGGFVGWGAEYKLFDTPIGAVSFMCETDLALYLDWVSTQVRWETEDFNAAYWRSRKMWEAVPGVQTLVGLSWYPYEAIKLEVGYDFMLLFNTVSSPRPIDMNIGTLDPEYHAGVFRYFQGFRGSISVAF